MTSYGRSPWIQEFPKSRVPSYPRHRGAANADVVIIGGGLAGCATAYAFSAAGVKVTLLEAAQVGRGSSASSTGWLNDDPGVGFADFEKAFGLRQATRLRGAAPEARREVFHRAACGRDRGSDAGAGGPRETRAEGASRFRDRGGPPQRTRDLE
jgi:glycine/D-amino acid oxidase-like deaminating enzyme